MSEKIPESPQVCRCKRCGGPVEEMRVERGIDLCYKCAKLVVSPYRQVEVSASSLQWI